MRWSVKKTIGGLGFLWSYGLAGVAVFQDVTMIGTVLWPILIASAALYGIKKFGPTNVDVSQRVEQ